MYARIRRCIVTQEHINPYRLPRDVVPVHYTISLQPDFANFTFSGSQKVIIDINAPVSEVVLHALDLTISKAVLRHPISGTHIPVALAFNREMETVTLNFGEILDPGRAELALLFRGELNDKMHGFYRTSYELNGAKRWGAATQFEATDARRAFPCWDEPDSKATFTVTLTVPETMTALSNMPVDPVAKVVSWNSQKSIVFQQTPRMSTYLVAFAIAELDCVEATDRNGIPIRVWATPDKKEHCRFALDVALHTLPYFAEWFAIPYGLVKLDMVALPDFASGAMENWGLVTYREAALLVDPKNSAAANRQRVAETVNHELAHMWFGDLVTMVWWTDLWLNEGFASYMGPKATDHQFHEWDIWTRFVADDHIGALALDSLESTHPVEVPVQNPYEIREVFDHISYAKGAVVIRMLAEYLGEESFRQGLHLYLTRHAYGNATTSDLWRALEDASGRPVALIMEGFTRQPGYPVLTVEESMRANSKPVLRVQQNRFFSDGREDTAGLLWQVPLGVLTRGSKDPGFRNMPARTTEFSISAHNSDWVKFNPGQSGLYRTAYPARLWQRLIGAVDANELSSVDRLGLLDDAFALARAGYVRSSLALSLLRVFRYEIDFSVWLTIAGSVRSVGNLLSQDPGSDRFVEVARNFFSSIAKSKGWEKVPSERHTDAMLRALALANFGKYGDQETIEEARQRFARFTSGGELDPDLRQVVYSLVVQYGGEAEFRDLMEIYKKAALHEEKIRVLGALGNLREKGLLANFLGLTFSEKVRPQDAPFVIIATARHPMGRALAWQFVKENWGALIARYHGGGVGLLNQLLEITSDFTTSAELDDVAAFFHAHKVPGTERTMAQCVERIRSGIAWLKRDREDIRQWLNP